MDGHRAQGCREAQALRGLAAHQKKQGAEAPCLNTSACGEESGEHSVSYAAANLSQLSEAQLHHQLFGFSHFYFDDLRLHRIPPAPLRFRLSWP